VRQPPAMLFCAGAVKSGTSWLYEYLRGHPETYLRSIKELQFFDRLHAGNLPGRIQSLDQEIAAFEAELETGTARWPILTLGQMGDRAEYKRIIQSGDAPIGAYLRYLTAGAEAQRLVGEMTPEYGLLPPEKMAEMTALAPDVRWIFLMRDPVARLWSHIRMLVRRSKAAPEDMARACEAKFNEVLAGKARDVTLRGDYQAIHTRLTQAVRPEKRLVMFYEHLLTPSGVAQVTDFLGLSRHPARLDRWVHEGQPVAMPGALRDRARDWLWPQYAFVAQTLGLPPEWEAFPELNSEVA